MDQYSFSPLTISEQQVLLNSVARRTAKAKIILTQLDVAKLRATTAESKERGKKGREEREGKDSHKRSSSDDPKSPSSHDGIEGTITWFTWFWMRTYRSVFWIRELQV